MPRGRILRQSINKTIKYSLSYLCRNTRKSIITTYLIQSANPHIELPFPFPLFTPPIQLPQVFITKES